MTMRLFVLITVLGLAIAPAAAQSPAPKATATPKPHSVHLKYNCDNLKVPVIYENAKDRVVVTYAAKSWILPHVPSADGARYMSSKLEWWEKGATATLSSVSGGKADTLLASCTAIPAKK